MCLLEREVVDYEKLKALDETKFTYQDENIDQEDERRRKFYPFLRL